MNIVLYGYGKMNRVVEKLIENSEDNIVGVVDFDKVTSLHDIDARIDVIIDFSHTSRIDDLLDYIEEEKVKTVIASTNLNEKHITRIHNISKATAIFQSYNTSYGVYVMGELLKIASEKFDYDFDVSLLDTHHNRKQDSPSGTAKLFSSIIGREDIQIQDFRIGDIIGTHDVKFTSNYEQISITHNAMSRDLFADGALKAARELCTKENGLYDLEKIYNRGE